MFEELLEIAGTVLLIVFCAWLGISYDAAEYFIGAIVGCIILVIVVRSAYRDACRRQRWPGKKRETIEN